MRHSDSTLGFYGSHFAVEPSQILHLARLWRFISYFMCMMLEAVRRGYLFNTLRLRQNGHRFADDTFKLIFLNEYVRILIKISLKFVPKGRINNNPSLDQIIAWRRSGDKPLSEPMMVSLLTHICVTRPQWVKLIKSNIRSSRLADMKTK